jgi:hypothetical protein
MEILYAIGATFVAFVSNTLYFIMISALAAIAAFLVLIALLLVLQRL